jgi:hypothetical protein
VRNGVRTTHDRFPINSALTIAGSPVGDAISSLISHSAMRGGSLGSKATSVVEILTESLILAQDERWRRA